MIKLLNSEDVRKHWKILKELLIYCREAGSAVVLPDSYYENKLNALIEYIEKSKAYFFVVQDNDSVVGFLWACEIERDAGRVFHIVHFAVLEEHQSKGYGKMLIEAAEMQAKRLGIVQLELNVSALNHKAIGFYKKNSFIDEHITMIKRLN